MWQTLPRSKPLPKFSKSALKLNSVEYVIQVNGKLRGHIEVASDAVESEIVDAAIKTDSVQQFLAGKDIKKNIVVKHRKLVNLVVG